MNAPLVVVSNRGPLNFTRDDDGALTARRAAGGLVVALGPGVQRSGALWVAAALSDADREAASAGLAGPEGHQQGLAGPEGHQQSSVIEAEGFRLRSLAIDAEDFAAYYNVVANGTLWYLNHGLWDLPRRPRFDRHWHQAWARFRAVNRHFAAAVADAADDGATVIVHDYHLALVAGLLARARPDLRAATFLHTPWCTPEELAVLPDAVGAELMEHLVAGGPCGFHSPRWARRYQACAAEVLGPGTAAEAFVAPAATDVDDLARVAGSAACVDELKRLETALDGRHLVVRVDRIELSKNILRGLWAFDAMLDGHPERVDTVTFGVFVYPSRLGLADYQAYGQEITTLVEHLNGKWGRPGWTPILLDTADHYPRSVAALRRYDVLLVNPVRDGLNLVAMEGPLINDRDGVVVLSRQAGCFDLLGEHAFGINPFDVAATGDALAAALGATPSERAIRAEGLRRAVSGLTPLRWWDGLVAGARREGPLA